jgi:nucleoside-diphosphate-sugar epimerase
MSKKIIAVFGSTGAQGGSVLRALLANGSYHVKALTRNAKSDKAKKLATLKNCSIAEADLDSVKSLDAALKGCYGSFLVTDSWSATTKDEIKQGKNAIDSAIRNGISHLVYSGLEHVKPILNKPCDHFDFKATIQDYGLKEAKNGKINFTSVMLPAYYENFGSFYNHKLKPNEYLVNVPMGGKPIFGMSVADLGECVVSVLQNPNEYKSKVIGLSSDNLTIGECVAIMNKHLVPNKFVDSQISLKQYAALGFPGAEELANMFEYYQTGKMQRDINLTKKLNKNLLNFEQWVVKNKQNLLNSFK